MKDLSQHLLDLLQNSLRAGAKNISVDIHLPAEHELAISVEDDGCGMDAVQSAQAAHPFFSTKAGKNVGLGLSLLKQNAQQAAGTFTLASEPGKGCRVSATFRTNHPDCLPLGDIPGALLLTCAANPATRFQFRYGTSDGGFTFDTETVKAAVGDDVFRFPEMVRDLSEMVRAQMLQHPILIQTFIK